MLLVLCLSLQPSRHSTRRQRTGSALWAREPQRSLSDSALGCTVASTSDQHRHRPTWLRTIAMYPAKPSMPEAFILGSTPAGGPSSGGEFEPFPSPAGTVRAEYFLTKRRGRLSICPHQLL